MFYIFLDIDGVLNDVRSPRIREGFPRIGANCIAQANQIYGFFREACWVLSSSWRHGHGANDERYFGLLKRFLAKQGLKGEIVSRTPHTPSGSRGSQIQRWMEANHVNVNDILILDDDRDMNQLTPRLIWTDGVFGLQPRDVLRALHLVDAAHLR